MFILVMVGSKNVCKNPLHYSPTPNVCTADNLINYTEFFQLKSLRYLDIARRSNDGKWR